MHGSSRAYGRFAMRRQFDLDIQARVAGSLISCLPAQSMRVTRGRGAFDSRGGSQSAPVQKASASCCFTSRGRVAERRMALPPSRAWKVSRVLSRWVVYSS